MKKIVPMAKGHGWIHDLLLTRFAPLDVDVNGQRGKAQKEFLAVDFDGPQGVQRVVGNERDAGMLRLDEQHRMLVAHQIVTGEARWVAHNEPPYTIPSDKCSNRSEGTDTEVLHYKWLCCHCVTVDLGMEEPNKNKNTLLIK